MTLRDHTELQGVTAELDTVRGMADALRAQNHEPANRLHTMVSVIEIGRPQEAVGFATQELDMNLLDGHGLDLLRQLRSTGRLHDVIAVTSARDADVVRQAVTHGVACYLLKPFTFAMFEDMLRQYA